LVFFDLFATISAMKLFYPRLKIEDKEVKKMKEKIRY
jgi:hypothetical protein